VPQVDTNTTNLLDQTDTAGYNMENQNWLKEGDNFLVDVSNTDVTDQAVPLMSKPSNECTGIKTSTYQLPCYFIGDLSTLDVAR